MSSDRLLITVVIAVVAPLVGITAGCDRTEKVPTTDAAERTVLNEIPKPVVAATDAFLAAQVAAALKADPTTRAADIQVTVAQGRVRLSGFVNNAAAKLRAGELAQQADGTVIVDNRLILRFHASVADPLADARVRL